MPGSPLFTRLFGRSPIAPLQDHMKISAQCAQQLLSYFEAVCEEDWDMARAIYDSIGKLEEQADEMKREIRINLPKSLFLPVSRSDLLELLHNQDRIPNRAKDIAGLILGRQMSMPEEIRTVMTEYVTVSVSATSFALKALEELDELVESGFSGREMDLIEKLVEDIDSAKVSDNMKPLLHFVKKLTFEPAKMVQADAEAVFSAGWSEQVLHDAINICCMFNFMNRIVMGHGGEQGDIGKHFKQLADGLVDGGYDQPLYTEAGVHKEAGV